MSEIEVARFGVILAGGASQRMPGGKPRARLGGRTLLAHAITIVEEAGLEPVVCTRPEVLLPPHAARVLIEPAVDATAHPLRGVAHALEQVGAPIVVLPVDLPFVPPAALRALAERREPSAVVAIDGRPAALVARISPTLAPRLREAAEEGAGVLRTLAGAGAALIDAHDVQISEPERELANLNTPAELAAAERRQR